jgi:hypothetical protein
MEELASRIGEIAVGAIIEAIRQRKSREQAVEDAIAALRREDVVSDELWNDLQRYIESTADFEENGAG